MDMYIDYITQKRFDQVSRYFHHVYEQSLEEIKLSFKSNLLLRWQEVNSEITHTFPWFWKTSLFSEEESARRQPTKFWREILNFCSMLNPIPRLYQADSEGRKWRTVS